MDHFLVSSLIFLAGIPVGYFGRIYQEKQLKTLHMKRKNKKSTLPKVGSIVFVLMTITLVISVIAEIFIPTYKTNPLFYGLLGTIAGLFWKMGDKS